MERIRNFQSKNRQEMDEILKKLENCKYEITEVKKGERIKNAPLPFTTSTLQQEAAKTLNFPHRRPCVWHSSYMRALMLKEAAQ